MFKVLSSKIVGGVFILAAILKLMSIDEFEIYIYSFNVFSFLATTFVSRLIIAGEFVLGTFLILNIYYDFTRKAILSILTLFALFLAYTAIFRNDDNCHCFGELIELNPIESIIKNVLIIILLLICKSSSRRSTVKNQRLKALVFGLLPLVAVFIVSPPDVVYNMIYSSEKEISSCDLYESFDNVKCMTYKEECTDAKSFVIDDDSQMIALVSAGCKYCRLGVKKLSLMMKSGEMDVDKVNVFIWGSPEGIENFRKETNTEDYQYWHIMPNEAINITYGRFPVFIWMENKDVVRVGDFRSL